MSDSTASELRARHAQSVRLLVLAIRMVWRVGPLLLIGLAALLIVSAVMPVVQLVFTSHAVDALVGLAAGGASEGSAVGQAVIWLALLAAALALNVVIGPVASLLQAMLGDRLSFSLSRALLAACNGWVGVGRFEDPTYADDLAISRTKAKSAIQVVLYGSQALVAVATAVGVGITLGGLSPLVPVVFVAASVPAAFWRWAFSTKTGSVMYASTPLARKMEYVRRLSVSTDVAKDVRLAGAHDYLLTRYRRDWETVETQVDGVRRRLGARVVLGEAVAGLTLAAIYAYLVWSAVRGQISIGELVMFAGAAMVLRGQLGQIAFAIGFLPIALGHLPSMERVLDAGPDLPVPTSPRPVPEPVRSGIAFEDVTFRYPGRSTDTLSHVSFTITPGESVALVGSNGAGKTTIVKLLLRLYDPTSGTITVDGIDIRDLSPDEWRRRIGVIFQDFGRYELTAGENIGLGDVSRIEDEDQIMAAAHKGGAADFLSQLPSGLSTALGRDLGEQDLSGGQWQRIALSRAFMAEPPLVVLDEPTAELDPRAEHGVFERFALLRANRMTLLISHRFSTVRVADRIIVLAGGQIIEDGSHRQLLADGGEYARMFRLQAEQYLGADLGSVAGPEDQP